jgi:hypothetical protein
MVAGAASLLYKYSMTERNPSDEVMKPLHKAFYDAGPIDVNGPFHPELVVAGYTEPGSLSARFIAEAARSPRSEVRLAALHMRKPLNEAPISRRQLSPDFVDPMPLNPHRAQRRPLSMIVKGFTRPPGGQAVKPEYRQSGLAGFFERGDEVLGAGETRRRAARRLASFAIGGVMVASLVALAVGDKQDKTGDATLDARQQAFGDIVTDGEKLRVLGLCADELLAEADMESHTLGTASHRRNTQININRLRVAGNTARISGVSCKPPSSPAVYETVINDIPVTITPADISRFDVATACHEWSGVLPHYTPDALAKMNKLRQGLIEKQNIAC